MGFLSTVFRNMFAVRCSLRGLELLYSRSWISDRDMPGFISILCLRKKRVESGIVTEPVFRILRHWEIFGFHSGLRVLQGWGSPAKVIPV